MWSDPRDHDLTVTPTIQELWVVALDLTPKAGQDPSHPAFYLPIQELLAGNNRGFGVADPCKADGQLFDLAPDLTGSTRLFKSSSQRVKSSFRYCDS